ncbi:TolC family protein [Fulvivirgaceae bacterium BMA12]|uniref:TolC family protein n=1 Tax=Agaribacillus aureus TaxID=3051825 RepID=A0ABT8LA83_9BACT|nr:TolC family protein [Fulvivirgaceae bacterium BMA12]
MKSKIIIIILLLAAHWSCGQDYPDYYLMKAAENNPGLKAEFNQYLAAMEQIPQAKAMPDPRITFDLFLQPIETRVGPQRAKLAVSQAFPWFGTLKAQGDMSAQLADARLKSFEDKKLQLFREVKTSYTQMYFIFKSKTLIKENLLLLQSFKELARVNFESGRTGFVNVLRVEMEEQELQQQLAFLDDSQQVEFENFKNLLNVPLDKLPDFPDTLREEKLNGISQSFYDSIISNNRQLQHLRLQTAARDKAVEVAGLIGKPSFTVGMSFINIGERSDVDIPDNGQDAFLLPQLGLNIPLHRKKYQAMKRQAVLQKESLEHQMEEESNRLATALKNFIAEHLDASRRLTLYQRLHNLAKQSLLLLQTEFSTGKTGFEEVLRMERKLLTYQLEIVKARVDVNKAVYNIDYLMGR